MVKLFCVLAFDLGSAFSVELDENSTIDKLKVAIKNAKSQMISCGADELQLYLAMQDREWLTSNTIQRIKTHLSSLERLDPPQKTLQCAGLGEGVAIQPEDEEIAQGRGHIHVVVNVPKYTPCDLYYPDQLRKMVEKTHENREMYTFADCPASKINELLAILGLSTKLLQIEESDDDLVQGFNWGDKAQHEDSKTYMTFLSDHLKSVFYPDEESSMKPQYVLEDTRTKELLTLSGAAWMEFDVSGSADMILVDRLAMRYRLPFAGLRFIIDAKKDLAANPDRYLRQMSLKLIVADFKSEKRRAPVGLLTDLDKSWYFVWFTEDKTIATLVLHCAAHGLQFMKDILSGDSRPSEQGIYTLTTRFVSDQRALKRRRLTFD